MPTGPNLILTAANATLQVTNLAAIGSQATGTLSFLPMGSVASSATGELGLKVLVIGGTGSGGTIPVVISEPTVTVVAATMAASASVTIPAGAKGWTFTVITGTGGIGGTTLLPAGFSDSDTKTLAASLTVTTASASTAYVRYNT